MQLAKITFISWRGINLSPLNRVCLKQEVSRGITGIDQPPHTHTLFFLLRTKHTYTQKKYLIWKEISERKSIYMNIVLYRMTSCHHYISYVCWKRNETIYIWEMISSLNIFDSIIAFLSALKNWNFTFWLLFIHQHLIILYIAHFSLKLVFQHLLMVTWYFRNKSKHVKTIKWWAAFKKNSGSAIVHY